MKSHEHKNEVKRILYLPFNNVFKDKSRHDCNSHYISSCRQYVCNLRILWKTMKILRGSIKYKTKLFLVKKYICSEVLLMSLKS